MTFSTEDGIGEQEGYIYIETTPNFRPYIYKPFSMTNCTFLDPSTYYSELYTWKADSSGILECQMSLLARSTKNIKKTVAFKILQNPPPFHVYSLLITHCYDFYVNEYKERSTTICGFRSEMINEFISRL